MSLHAELQLTKEEVRQLRIIIELDGWWNFGKKLQAVVRSSCCHDKEREGNASVEGAITNEKNGVARMKLAN